MIAMSKSKMNTTRIEGNDDKMHLTSVAVGWIGEQTDRHMVMSATPSHLIILRSCVQADARDRPVGLLVLSTNL